MLLLWNKIRKIKSKSKHTKVKSNLMHRPFNFIRAIINQLSNHSSKGKKEKKKKKAHRANIHIHESTREEMGTVFHGRWSLLDGTGFNASLSNN